MQNGRETTGLGNRLRGKDETERKGGVPACHRKCHQMVLGQLDRHIQQCQAVTLDVLHCSFQ